MGFSGKKWELFGDRGIYGNYGRYTLSWGLHLSWLLPSNVLSYVDIT